MLAVGSVGLLRSFGACQKGEKADGEMMCLLDLCFSPLGTTECFGRTPILISARSTCVAIFSA